MDKVNFICKYINKEYGVIKKEVLKNRKKEFSLRKMIDINSEKILSIDTDTYKIKNIEEYSNLSEIEKIFFAQKEIIDYFKDKFNLIINYDDIEYIGHTIESNTISHLMIIDTKKRRNDMIYLDFDTLIEESRSPKLNSILLEMIK